MRADRLISLVLLLQTEGRMTARTLAARLEVSERTILRDLNALSCAGIPVYAERGPGGGCALPMGYRTSLTGLTQAEVRALFLPETPGPLADLRLGAVRDALLLKLLAALPTSRRRDAEWARERLYLDADPWFRRPEAVPHLNAVQAAVWEDRCVRVAYRDRRGVASRNLVEPYALVAKASVWYLVAKRDAQMRVYRVSRMEAVDPIEQSFRRDADFNVAAFWVRWMAEFEATLARYPVSVRVVSTCLDALPPGQEEDDTAADARQVEPADHAEWRTLGVEFESFADALQHVLQLGENIEVLAPAELRVGVARIAARIVARYSAAHKTQDGERRSN